MCCTTVHNRVTSAACPPAWCTVQFSMSLTYHLWPWKSMRRADQSHVLNTNGWATLHAAGREIAWGGQRSTSLPRKNYREFCKQPSRQTWGTISSAASRRPVCCLSVTCTAVATGASRLTNSLFTAGVRSFVRIAYNFAVRSVLFVRTPDCRKPRKVFLSLPLSHGVVCRPSVRTCNTCTAMVGIFFVRRLYSAVTNDVFLSAVQPTRLLCCLWKNWELGK